jgi:hypothetical protein
MVVAFDYHDGPESGLAIYASGEGVRFSSVGDSESRLRRGFEMEAIEGDWWPPIRELIRQEGVLKPRRMLVPGPSETLTSLRENVARAVAKKQFVAVGTPDLFRLSVIPVRDAEMSHLRELGCSAVGFRFANALVKGRKRSKGQTD